MSCLNSPRISLVQSPSLAGMSRNFPPRDVSEGPWKPSGMAATFAGILPACSGRFQDGDKVRAEAAGIDVEIEVVPLFRLEPEPSSRVLFGDDSVERQRGQHVGGVRVFFVLVGSGFEHIGERRNTNPVW